MRIFLLDNTYKGENLYKMKKKEITYINKVLRVQVGDSFAAKDSSDNYYKVTLIDEETLSCTLDDSYNDYLMDSLSKYRNDIIKIHVYQALCKGKKNETIARMMAEAGVYNITFVQSEFTQVKALSNHDNERIETIKKEAIQQSGSNTILENPPVLHIYNIIPEINCPLLVLHQNANTKTLNERLIDLCGMKEIAILIGSEGGFSDEEIEYLEKQGALTTVLKTNILRAETAGIFAIGAIESLL